MSVFCVLRATAGAGRFIRKDGQVRIDTSNEFAEQILLLCMVFQWPDDRYCQSNLPHTMRLYREDGDTQPSRDMLPVQISPDQGQSTYTQSQLGRRNLLVD